MRQAERPSRSDTPRPGRIRSVLAFVLLGVVAAGCFFLGMWQLGRAAERDALHAAIESGRLQAPLALSTRSFSADFIPWRAAQAQGRWSPRHTVLLENRNLDGQPGYWVATPLLLDPPPVPGSRLDAISAGSAEISAMTGAVSGGDFMGQGPANGTAAVLVLRGWLPRDMRAVGTLPRIPVEPGEVAVRGELNTHVPRIFELWEWAGGSASRLPDTIPPPDGGIPVVQNLALAEYARASGLQLLPTVLAQTGHTIMLEPAETAPMLPQGIAEGASPAQAGASPPPRHASDTALRREWPGPSLDSDQNRGYALQWFSFSAIAAIAALFVLRGLLRRPPQRRKQ